MLEELRDRLERRQQVLRQELDEFLAMAMKPGFPCPLCKTDVTDVFFDRAIQRKIRELRVWTEG